MPEVITLHAADNKKRSRGRIDGMSPRHGGVDWHQSACQPNSDGVDVLVAMRRHNIALQKV
jgi:hypothetical protein